MQCQRRVQLRQGIFWKIGDHGAVLAPFLLRLSNISLEKEREKDKQLAWINTKKI
jgi:hypothetical protein